MKKGRFSEQKREGNDIHGQDLTRVYVGRPNRGTSFTLLTSTCAKNTVQE